MTPLESQKLVVALVAHLARGDNDAMRDLLYAAGAADWRPEDWLRVLRAAVAGIYHCETHHAAEHHDLDPVELLTSWPLRAEAVR